MKHTFRHTFHTIGGRTGEFARDVGFETAHLARRFGDRTAHLARRVGRNRGLLGLALAALGIGGGVMLMRFLRSRRARNTTGMMREEEAKRGAGARGHERVTSPGVGGETGRSY